MSRLWAAYPMVDHTPGCGRTRSSGPADVSSACHRGPRARIAASKCLGAVIATLVAAGVAVFVIHPSSLSHLLRRWWARGVERKGATRVTSLVQRLNEL